jgi:hypothetical protein
MKDLRDLKDLTMHDVQPIPRKATAGSDVVRLSGLECRQCLGQAVTRPPSLSHRMYLLISFRRSTPPQNRQLIVSLLLIKT